MMFQLSNATATNMPFVIFFFFGSKVLNLLLTYPEILFTVLTIFVLFISFNVNYYWFEVNSSNANTLIEETVDMVVELFQS